MSSQGEVIAQGVVEEGVKILRNYACGKTGPRGQVRIRQVARGAIPLLMTLFDRNTDDRGDNLSVEIIRSLTGECGNEDLLTDNRVAIMEAGGIERIIRHVEAFQGRPFRDAMIALESLCKHYACAEKVASLKGIALILRAKSQLEVTNTYEHKLCVNALSALCQHGRLVDGIATAGGIDAPSADAVLQLLQSEDIEPEQREAIQRLLPRDLSLSGSSSGVQG
jgi:hypothetical protein